MGRNSAICGLLAVALLLRRARQPRHLRADIDLHTTLHHHAVIACAEAT